MNFRAILLLLLGINLTACVTFPTEESAQVKILWENSVAIENCTYKGTVIGSQGHFYDYWLHSDRDMVWGTLNELRTSKAMRSVPIQFISINRLSF